MVLFKFFLKFWKYLIQTLELFLVIRKFAVMENVLPTNRSSIEYR